MLIELTGKVSTHRWFLYNGFLNTGICSKDGDTKLALKQLSFKGLLLLLFFSRRGFVVVVREAGLVVLLLGYARLGARLQECVNCRSSTCTGTIQCCFRIEFTDCFVQGFLIGWTTLQGNTATGCSSAELRLFLQVLLLYALHRRDAYRGGEGLGTHG